MQKQVVVCVAKEGGGATVVSTEEGRAIRSKNSSSSDCSFFQEQQTIRSMYHHLSTSYEPYATRIVAFARRKLQDKGAIGVQSQTSVEARCFQPGVSFSLQVLEHGFGDLVHVDGSKVGTTVIFFGWRCAVPSFLVKGQQLGCRRRGGRRLRRHDQGLSCLCQPRGRPRRKRQQIPRPC